MADGETTDVNQEETTTSTDPSTDTTTSTETTDAAAVDTATAEEDKSEELKTIPYNRFKEVNEEARSYKEQATKLQQQIDEIKAKGATNEEANADPRVKEARNLMKNMIKEMAPELGLVSREELNREKEDQHLQSFLTNLESKYDGKDDPALKFDRQKVIDFAIKNNIGNPEYAYKIMTEKARTNLAIKQALAKGKGFASETSNGTGSSGGAGPTNAELEERISKGDSSAKKLLFKRMARNHLKTG